MQSSAIPEGHIRLIRLQREGALRVGDVVATARLGECRVGVIQSSSSLLVEQIATGRWFNLSGIFFPGARLVETPPKA